jgi:hypothetical protein
VVSNPEVNRRLREFVCIRLDHEQMQRLKVHLKVPTQGNQVLLNFRGEYIEGTDPRGKRYKVDELVTLLDRVLAEHPLTAAQKDDLKLAWFYWNVEDQGLPPYFGAETICRLDRKPLLVIDGDVPEWLDQPEYLRRHLRQFIWKRGEADAAPRITIRQLEPRRRDLATIDPADVTPERLSELLDDAWRAYMVERPLTARGYIDNEHGNWLRRVMEGAYEDELRIQDEAQRGVLQPPGRDDSRP